MAEFRFNYQEVLRFHERLEALRIQLLELEVKNTSEALNELSLETTDELSHIRTHEERALELAEHENHEIREIDDALYKLNSGTFGTCENCNCEIPLSRVEALPHTRYCAPCEAQLEANGHARARPEARGEGRRV